MIEQQCGVLEEDGYLVVYDYGMGGLWALIKAETPEVIKARYPQLKVFDHRPQWMSESDYERIRDTRSFDLDGAAGWVTSAGS